MKLLSGIMRGRHPRGMAADGEGSGVTLHLDEMRLPHPPGCQHVEYDPQPGCVVWGVGNTPNNRATFDSGDETSRLGARRQVS